jgi:hypothetical protein
VCGGVPADIGSGIADDSIGEADADVGEAGSASGMDGIISAGEMGWKCEAHTDCDNDLYCGTCASHSFKYLPALRIFLKSCALPDINGTLPHVQESFLVASNSSRAFFVALQRTFVFSPHSYHDVGVGHGHICSGYSAGRADDGRVD